MVTLTLSGRSYEIAPYKLGALRRAAPHIDALNAFFRQQGAAMAERQAEIATLPEDERETALEALAADSSIESMFAPIGIVAEIVAVGMQKLDPKFTAEYLLEEEIGFDDQPALMATMRALLAESGLASKGEATAPSAPGPAEGALSDKSETASAS